MGLVAAESARDPGAEIARLVFRPTPCRPWSRKPHEMDCGDASRCLLVADRLVDLVQGKSGVAVASRLLAMPTAKPCQNEVLLKTSAATTPVAPTVRILFFWRRPRRCESLH